MNSRYMLDSDTCSFIIRGGSEILREKVERHANSLCVSAVTEAELRFGAKRRGSARITSAVEFFLDLVEIVPWGGTAARRYAEIRTSLEAAGTPIGSMDMLIAASALAEGCRLVTHNTAHFSRVSGLVIEDWV